MRHVLDNGICTSCPDAVRHLPGLHDQSSHGRRFKVPGDPKSGLRKALKGARKAEKPATKAEPRFEPKTVAELQKAQDDYLARTGSQLTEDQRFALKAYSLAAYEGMNGWLRGRKGYENPPDAVKRAVEDAKSAMIPLQVDAVFERGANWDGLPEGFRDPEKAKQLVGRTIEDPGFLSTSVPGSRLKVRGQVKLTIEAPKGSKGRFIRDVSEIKDEDEYIVAPGSRYKVLEVSGEDPVQVRVRVVA